VLSRQNAQALERQEVAANRLVRNAEPSGDVADPQDT
jgi:hypothetical protein